MKNNYSKNLHFIFLKNILEKNAKMCQRYLYWSENSGRNEFSWKNSRSETLLTFFLMNFWKN